MAARIHKSTKPDNYPGRVSVRCENCGNSIWAWPSNLKRGKNRFCSHACRNKFCTKARLGSLDDRIQGWRRLSATNEKGCWLWPSCNGKGYGSTSFNGKKHVVHSLVYEHLRGPVPSGKELDHLCRNRRCWNPDHLEAVTHQVNTQRGDGGRNMSDRTHCNHGHLFDKANTGRRPNGGRVCRSCNRERRAQWRKDMKLKKENNLINGKT